MDESRKQFEWWYLLNWGHTEDNEDSMFEVDTKNGNYHRLGVRMAYDAWQAGHDEIAKGSIVAYQDPYGNAVSAGDFDGGEDEMHETAYQEGWTPLVRAAGIKVKR